MIAFSFENLHADSPSLTEPHEFLLRIVADFSIRSQGRLLYEEQEFCVVEFAQQMSDWLKDTGVTDFEYDALDAVEPGLVWFRSEKDGWRVGSLFQEYPELQVYSKDELKKAAIAFMEQLDSAIEANFQTRLQKVFEDVAPR